MDIIQSNFEDNAATLGGAVFAEQQSIINITDSTFVRQSASEEGGVLFADKSDVSIYRCVFRDNIAGYSGGVMYSQIATITVKESQFETNYVEKVGGVFVALYCIVTINSSNFTGNELRTDVPSNSQAGVMYAVSSMITITSSTFHSNSALFAGVLNVQDSWITLRGNIFDENYAGWQGGALEIVDSRAEIESNHFGSNVAHYKGGAVYFNGSNVSLQKCEFNSNYASNWGGAIDSTESQIVINAGTFYNNSVSYQGGALRFDNDIVTLIDNWFTNNNAPTGSVIYASQNSTIHQLYTLLANHNWAERYGMVYLIDSEFHQHQSGNATFINNFGSVMLFNSNITINGYLMSTLNNQPRQKDEKAQFQEGGAITLFLSNAFIGGTLHFEYNRADNGGAVFSIGSKVYVEGNVTISNNTALISGGGGYFSNSEVLCQPKSTVLLMFNSALSKGGGLHVDGSTIKTAYATLSRYDSTYIGAKLNFTKNSAKNGGGLSMEANARLYSMKYNSYVFFPHFLPFNLNDANVSNSLIFVNNHADYGGAVFVDDNTIAGTCTALPPPDCFFQVVAIYDFADENIFTRSFSFSNNVAHVSGSTLYGGLLDRCAVNQFAEVRKKHVALQPDVYEGNGITYFTDVSNATNNSISS